MQEALQARDHEIVELKELLQMREESLDDMRVRLEEAAVAAEKAADAAQHVGRERDRIRMEAARLCSDLEGRFGDSDRRLKALQVERDGAVAALADARGEIQKLRAALGSVAPGLLEVLGASTLPPPPQSAEDAAPRSEIRSALDPCIHLSGCLCCIDYAQHCSKQSSRICTPYKLQLQQSPLHSEFHQRCAFFWLKSQQPSCVPSGDVLSVVQPSPSAAPCRA